MKDTLRKLLRELNPRNLALEVVAGLTNAVAVNFFLSPVRLFDSGISGTSMLLGQITPLSLSVFLLLLNIPLFLYGAKRQGFAFTIYSLVSVFSYSVSSYVISTVFSIEEGAGSLLAGDDLLLCAVFGGLIAGTASGMSVRFGGAIDGMEVMAVIFARRLSLTIGNFILIYNVILYIIAGFALDNFTLALYSILTYFAANKMIDLIVDGLDREKSAMIITTKAEEISSELSEAFGHGITHIDSKGYYKGAEQTVIYFVVNRFQVARMKDIIRSIDRHAFVTISEVSDVMGSSRKGQG